VRHLQRERRPTLDKIVAVNAGMVDVVHQARYHYGQHLPGTASVLLLLVLLALLALLALVLVLVLLTTTNYDYDQHLMGRRDSTLKIF